LYPTDEPRNIVWSELFGNDRPVEIEVGFGKGMFLLNAASTQPDVNFFGIEIERKYQLYAATRIAARELRNVRVDPAGQLQSFAVSAQCQALQRVAQVVAQVKLGGFKLELAGIDLGKIENVVDDGAQRIRRGLDELQALTLIPGQFRIKEQFREPENAVHGRANFVAHVGQEFALRPAGGFGGFLGPLQFLLGILAVRDIAGTGVNKS